MPGNKTAQKTTAKTAGYLNPTSKQRKFLLDLISSQGKNEQNRQRPEETKTTNSELSNSNTQQRTHTIYPQTYVPYTHPTPPAAYRCVDSPRYTSTKLPSIWRTGQQDETPKNHERVIIGLWAQRHRPSNTVIREATTPHEHTALPTYTRPQRRHTR